MSTTDESVSKLIINQLTREQYDNIPVKSDTELYIVSDDDTFATTSDVERALETKQNVLVSGINIKTINNQSILGAGNIDVSGSGGLQYAMVITDYTAQE